MKSFRKLSCSLSWEISSIAFRGPIHHVVLDLLHHVLIHLHVLGPALGALEPVDVLVDDADLLVDEPFDHPVDDGDGQGKEADCAERIRLDKCLDPQPQDLETQCHPQDGDDGERREWPAREGCERSFLLELVAHPFDRLEQVVSSFSSACGCGRRWCGPNHHIPFPPDLRQDGAAGEDLARRTPAGTAIRIPSWAGCAPRRSGSRGSVRGRW